MNISVHPILPVLTLDRGGEHYGPVRRCITRQGWRQTAAAMLRREARARNRSVTAAVRYGILGGNWGKLRART